MYILTWHKSAFYKSYGNSVILNDIEYCRVITFSWRLDEPARKPLDDLYMRSVLVDI